MRGPCPKRQSQKRSLEPAQDPVARRAGQISGAWQAPPQIRRPAATPGLRGLPSSHQPTVQRRLRPAQANSGCPASWSKTRRFPSRSHKTPSTERRRPLCSASRMPSRLLTSSARPGPCSCSRLPWFHERVPCSRDRCPPPPRRRSVTGTDKAL